MKISPGQIKWEHKQGAGGRSNTLHLGCKSRELGLSSWFCFCFKKHQRWTLRHLEKRHLFLWALGAGGGWWGLGQLAENMEKGFFFIKHFFFTLFELWNNALPIKHLNKNVLSHQKSASDKILMAQQTALGLIKKLLGAANAQSGSSAWLRTSTYQWGQNEADQRWPWHSSGVTEGRWICSMHVNFLVLPPMKVHYLCNQKQTHNTY